MSFPTFADYLAARAVVDKTYLAFADELLEADFEKTLDYRNFEAGDVEAGLKDWCCTSSTIQTHHRGMAALYLDQMGVANDFSNISSMI